MARGLRRRRRRRWWLLLQAAANAFRWKTKQHISFTSESSFIIIISLTVSLFSLSGLNGLCAVGAGGSESLNIFLIFCAPVKWRKYAAQIRFRLVRKRISLRLLRNRRQHKITATPFSSSLSLSFKQTASARSMEVSLESIFWGGRNTHEWAPNTHIVIFKMDRWMSPTFIHLVRSNQNHHLIWIFPKWFGINEVNRPKILGFRLASSLSPDRAEKWIVFLCACTRQTEEIAQRAHNVRRLTSTAQLSAHTRTPMNLRSQKDRIYTHTFYSIYFAAPQGGDTASG